MINKQFFILAILCFNYFALSCQVENELTIQLTGLETDNGKVYVSLFDNEDTWLGDGIQSGVSDIVDGKATIILTGVENGIYAISSYHDTNDNQQLDTGAFGIPKEPYACSKGAKGIFGPPKWKNAKFEITSKTHTESISY